MCPVKHCFLVCSSSELKLYLDVLEIQTLSSRILELPKIEPKLTLRAIVGVTFETSPQDGDKVKGKVTISAALGNKNRRFTPSIRSGK